MNAALNIINVKIILYITCQYNVFCFPLSLPPLLYRAFTSYLAFDHLSRGFPHKTPLCL